MVALQSIKAQVVPTLIGKGKLQSLQKEAPFWKSLSTRVIFLGEGRAGRRRWLEQGTLFLKYCGSSHK